MKTVPRGYPPGETSNPRCPRCVEIPVSDPTPTGGGLKTGYQKNWEKKTKAVDESYRAFRMLGPG
jgi:hypothetical protein